MLEQLKRDFGCATLDDARAERDDARDVMYRKAELCQTHKQQFEAEFAAVLEEMEPRRG